MTRILVKKPQPRRCPEGMTSGPQRQGPTLPQRDALWKHSSKPDNSNIDVHKLGQHSLNNDTKSTPASASSCTITGAQTPQMQRWLNQAHRAEAWHHPQAIKHQDHSDLSTQSPRPSTTSADTGNTQRRLRRTLIASAPWGTHPFSRTVQGFVGDRAVTQSADHPKSARRGEDLVGVGCWADGWQTKRK